MNLQRLEIQLAIEEGAPTRTYLDTKGILTGGVGHNLIAHPEPGFDRIGVLVPADVRSRWFKTDIQGAISDLNHHCPWWHGMDDVRQNTIANLMFNMGWGNGVDKGLSTFKNTLAAFAIKDYTRAAIGFKNSMWANDVGPVRCNRICNMIATGQWPTDIAWPADFSDVVAGSSTTSR